MEGRRGKNQGEGDRESARRFNKSQQRFVESGEGQDEIERLARGGEDIGKEFEEAEREAAGRAREKDPAVSRDYNRPAR